MARRMIVSINSGETPTAVGTEPGSAERESIYTKWQLIGRDHTYPAPKILEIINEIDEYRYWEEDFYNTRSDFIKNRVLIHYDTYDSTIPAILNKLRQGVLPPLREHGGSASTGPRPATVEKAEAVRELRAEGKTQREVAEELGVNQQRVAQLENTSFQGSSITSKTSSPTEPIARGTGRPYTIARLRRDGYEELAKRVEAGEVTAAAARREAGIDPPPLPARERVLRALKRLSAEDRDWVLENVMLP